MTSKHPKVMFKARIRGKSTIAPRKSDKEFPIKAPYKAPLTPEPLKYLSMSMPSTVAKASGIRKFSFSFFSELWIKIGNKRLQMR